MKKLLWLNATLLLGTSGALLWLFLQIIKHGRILLEEPNIYILLWELWIILWCLAIAVGSLSYLVKGVRGDRE